MVVIVVVGCSSSSSGSSCNRGGSGDSKPLRHPDDTVATVTAEAAIPTAAAPPPHDHYIPPPTRNPNTYEYGVDLHRCPPQRHSNRNRFLWHLNYHNMGAHACAMWAWAFGNTCRRTTQARRHSKICPPSTTISPRRSAILSFQTCPNTQAQMIAGSMML